MNKWIKWMLMPLCAVAMLPGSASADETTPRADDLLAAVRKMTVSQGERDVRGTIRKGRNQVPFSLSSRGDTIVFQYKQKSGWERFDVRISETNVSLYRVTGNKAAQMSPKDYTDTIAGTDVCYEDLSLRFLYWKGGRVLEDTSDSRIKGRDCYIVEVPNPNADIGQFAWVRVWVDKENGTTWQIDGYGRDGKLKKRFTITSVQKLSDGSWFFKQMKLEIRNPQNPSRTSALNYLEMEDLPDARK
ncbi:MAG TPA: outer membrane lipoprotein-sorting protein [Candidatus Akkermansia intestinigallinarum]|uniref:Outer membrane lipoprotein-sorting protein n=1 Tax=Candidatus Akkermansia intestinigallinarum TaxID=2838431 RepID=A0A9D1V9I2_9BACT|nr:outer membrane lipoprotein-sorting protein [Candidatus Akkermansia intestinigallinarum]